MSYSRWLTSRWYVFWSSDSGDTKDSQILEICLDGQVTYKELAENFEENLELIIERENNESDENHQVTEKEKEELRGYFLAFMKDVEEEYK